MLKAVLFDLDNTLYDYDSANEFALKALHQEFQKDSKMDFPAFLALYKSSQNEVKRKLVGTAASHERILYLQELTERVHKTVKTDRILTLYHAYWDTLVEKAKLFDGVIETLQWLQQNGIKIIIVTNLTTYVQIRKIDSLKISDYIDFIVTSQEAGYDKPHPSNFLFALHKANLLAEDVIMVGDSLSSDIEGANAIGARSILYKFGKQKENPDTKPTYTVSNQAELLELLKQLAKE